MMMMGLVQSEGTTQKGAKQQQQLRGISSRRLMVFARISWIISLRGELYGLLLQLLLRMIFISSHICFYKD